MSSNLSELLKTLSGAEKRYCTLYLKTFSNQESVNKTINDFIQVKRQSKKIDSKQTVLTIGNSTRLYYKILDALFLFHQETILPDENLLVRRARVLYTKGFHKEGFKITEKVLNQNPHDNHLLKIEVIELRMLNALKTSNLPYLKKDFTSDKLKLEELSKEYFNLLEYERLWATFRLESTNSYFFGEKDTIKSKLLHDEDKAISPLAKILYNKIKGFIAVKEADYPSANFYANRAKLLYELNPYLIKKDPGDYLRSVSNLCLALMFNHMYDSANSILNDFQNHPIEFTKYKNADVLSEYFKLRVLLRMVVFISANTIMDHYDEVKELEDIYNELSDSLPIDEKLNTSLSLSIFHLSAGQYRKSLKQINYVIKNAEKFRRDIFHLALMIELTIHYLNGNIDLLESKLNSFKRIINNSQPPFGFEKDIPSLLTKIIQSPEDKTNFTKLHDTITSSVMQENKQVYLNFIGFYHIRYNK